MFIVPGAQITQSESTNTAVTKPEPSTEYNFPPGTEPYTVQPTTSEPYIAQQRTSEPTLVDPQPVGWA